MEDKEATNEKPPLQIKDFHPKLQQMFLGKESKLRMMDEWILLETLGMGGYSKVKLGVHCKTTQKAALKIMFADQSGKMSESKKKQLLSELSVMKKVDHPNVIKLLEFNEKAKYPEPNNTFSPCIMTALELAPGGELFDYLMYSGHFDDAATRSYFKQLIDGLQAMHSVGFAHRDLKPENLLLDRSFTLKIADFGFATSFVDDAGQERLMKTPCGTRNYLAPEFWRREEYSYKCDIFAAGIILFTVWAGFPPFMEAQPKDWWWDKFSIAIAKIKRANDLRRVLKQNPALKADANSAENKEMNACVDDARKRMQLFWKAHSKKRQFEDDDFKDIALNLIHPDPKERMDLSQIVQHKWVTKGPWYNGDELKQYLGKRVKQVLRRRAHKIQEMMTKQAQKPQQPPPENGAKRGIGSVNDPNSKLREQINVIDKEHDYDHSCAHVNDALFPDTIHQFTTTASPAEVAVRLQCAVVKLQGDIHIQPADNLITIKCAFSKPIEMPDDTVVHQKDEITFVVKQFFVSPKPTLDDGQHLYELEDGVTYLVSFKRLQGIYDGFDKIAKTVMENEDVRSIIQLKQYMSQDNNNNANGNVDDLKDDQ
eukprot:CAMPEP_0202692086 /NCGR_PEP_ID=MMETSP1385-20130828/6563_1 /ASSEMBLY_ACC=CAM_ASM_000861 /TAXON_ID=933848 /ORGANISM="Elphidium margaritaceum" /LENGTH=595 /DNA_ID=CAMNT_0049347561 /DNA_START=96 /DNA_END=1883 /DNA_ORIENTATION=+